MWTGPVLRPEHTREDQRSEMLSDIDAIMEFEPAIPLLKGTSPHTFDRRLRLVQCDFAHRSVNLEV
jgi:hypothetical protein